MLGQRILLDTERGLLLRILFGGHIKAYVSFQGYKIVSKNRGMDALHAQARANRGDIRPGIWYPSATQPNPYPPLPQIKDLL